MPDHNPMPVAGYTTQSQERLDEVNINKRLEEVVLRRLDDLVLFAGKRAVDPRCIAVGRTKIEEAFMWINRGIMQPQRAKVEE